MVFLPRHFRGQPPTPGNLRNSVGRPAVRSFESPRHRQNTPPCSVHRLSPRWWVHRLVVFWGPSLFPTPDRAPNTLWGEGCLGTQNPLQNHLQKGLEHKEPIRWGLFWNVMVGITRSKGFFIFFLGLRLIYINAIHVMCLMDLFRKIRGDELFFWEDMPENAFGCLYSYNILQLQSKFWRGCSFRVGLRYNRGPPFFSQKPILNINIYIYLYIYKYIYKYIYIYTNLQGLPFPPKNPSSTPVSITI